MRRQRRFEQLCDAYAVTRRDSTDGAAERNDRAGHALALYVLQNRAHVTVASDERAPETLPTLFGAMVAEVIP